VLELGGGPGAATSALRRKFARVTSLEYSAAFAVTLARDSRNGKSLAQYSAAPTKGTPRGARAQHADGGEMSLTSGAAVVRNAMVVQGDAARLPFAAESFSCAIAILVLHHLRSRDLQDAALAEIVRVLRPGGVFLALEIHDGWLQRLVHTRSTFVPFAASAANARLNAAGFARVAVDFMRGGFLLRAQRGAE
jgi:SAM-dependent methyltransferase